MVRRLLNYKYIPKSKYQIKEKDLKKESYSCGLDAVLDVVGGKWKFLIMWNLATGPKRFGELRRLVEGVSEKVLIQDLKEMVHDGIILRQDFQEVPPKVEYRLTDLGFSLAQACRPLCEWGSEHTEILLKVRSTCSQPD